MAPPLSHLDAPTLRKALSIYSEALLEHRDEIDSLNVYPIPDGDTGTNLLLTQQAVQAALSGLPRDASLAEVGGVVSRAALMGARGNSGVILSQVLRGLFERLPPAGEVPVEQLAIALEHAADEAYRAVARPEEGTVLTVLRDAAGAARGASGRGVATREVVDAVLEAARRSLARTREVHPELARAGVVDAGGRGILLLFDALRAAVTGEGRSETPGTPGPIGRRPHGEPAGARADAPGLEFPFEVQYLLESEEDVLTELRAAMGALGDSLVIVGGGGLYNVHIHTDRPDEAVDAGRRIGALRDLSIVDLQGQVEACSAGQARAVRLAEQACALVAVAEGSGLSRAFRSLGAIVVPGGPGNNPAVAGLLAALEAAPADAVVLLPNHRNVVPAAERAAQESSKEVAVVPSRSIPAGLSAATAFNPFLDLEANAKAMRASAEATLAGELARAQRDAETPAGRARRGDWMGMVEGEAVFIGSSVADAAREVVRRLVHADAEVLTLVAGADASEEDRQAVEAELREAAPHLGVEVVEGAQPRYPFLIGVE